MRNILIGSRALNFYSPWFKIKEDTDWDVISESPIEGTEWHPSDFLNNYKLEQYTCSEDKVVLPCGQEAFVLSRKGQAIVKRSHLWRDLSFNKHITHYHKHLVQYRTDFSSYDEAFLRERTALSYVAFPKQGPNLRQKVEDFFTDGVEKRYNHDWLHELYAYYSSPLYKSLQTSSETAWCEKGLWEGLAFEEKLKCVAEECYVLATERFLVPSSWKMPYGLAFNKAVQKVCTTTCSGWFRCFAIDFYPEVLGLMDKGKFENVREILERKKL